MDDQFNFDFSQQSADKPQQHRPLVQQDSEMDSPPLLMEFRPPTPPKHISESHAIRSMLKPNYKQKALDLIHWREPKHSGVVMVGLLVTLLFLARYSVISLFSYLGLSVLVVTVSYRLFHLLLAAMKGTAPVNPFEEHLYCEVQLHDDRIHDFTSQVVRTATEWTRDFRELLLFEKPGKSLKLALLCLVMLLVSRLISDLTIAILAVLLVFSLPKIYETRQEEIDAHVGQAKEKIGQISQQVTSKLRFAHDGTASASAQ